MLAGKKTNYCRDRVKSQIQTEICSHAYRACQHMIALGQEGVVLKSRQTRKQIIVGIELKARSKQKFAPMLIVPAGSQRQHKIKKEKVTSLCSVADI